MPRYIRGKRKIQFQQLSDLVQAFVVQTQRRGILLSLGLVITDKDGQQPVAVIYTGQVFLNDIHGTRLHIHHHQLPGLAAEIAQFIVAQVFFAQLGNLATLAQIGIDQFADDQRRCGPLHRLVLSGKDIGKQFFPIVGNNPHLVRTVIDGAEHPHIE